MHHLPRFFGHSSKQSKGMDRRKNSRKPKLERRNAVKHIEYDAASSSSSLEDSSSFSSSLHTRSLDLSDRTSFRIEGIDGEFDVICKRLGLSGPEDFAIPAAAWEARKIRSSSDLLPRSRLQGLDSPKIEEVKDTAVRTESEAEAEAVAELICERIVDTVRIVDETELTRSDPAESSGCRVTGGCGGGGGGGIKGTRPPVLKPPPGMRLPAIDMACSTWDLLKDFAGDGGSVMVHDGLLSSSSDEEVKGKNSTNYEKLSHHISAERAYFWLFEIAYFTILLILSLLSTSAVVYTVACIFTAKEITFKKVMSVVPKVWKRLMVTFLWSFAILFVYNIVAIVIIFLLAVFFLNSVIGNVIIIILVILYLMGFVYISIVWQLASVVSVLEAIRGIQAMKKSKTLIKGKMGVAVAFFILLYTCFVGIELVFGYIVVGENVPDIAIRIVVGILSFLFLFKLILIALVVQTVVYFVCKSYHHQTIDKSALADHLEAVYLGDYVPLRKDVQLSDTHA